MIKILCIVDSYDWALANRARSLEKHLTKYNFEIKHFNDLKGINFNNYNIVYVLNWPIHGYIESKIGRGRKYKLVTSVSSHVGRKDASSMRSLFNQYDAISTSSNFLYKEFKPVYGSKVFYTPFGVETDLFTPKIDPSINYDKFAWVGNSSRDVKRYPEIQKVFSSIPDAKLLTVTGGYSREKMNSFYNKVGTVICYSISEGTPNPILEGASCGRSIISTNVGNVPELISKSTTLKPIVSSADLKLEIIKRLEEPKILDLEGDFLRKEVLKDWSWHKRSKSFVPFLGL